MPARTAHQKLIVFSPCLVSVDIASVILVRACAQNTKMHRKCSLVTLKQDLPSSPYIKYGQTDANMTRKIGDWNFHTFPIIFCSQYIRIRLCVMHLPCLGTWSVHAQKQTNKNLSIFIWSVSAYTNRFNSSVSSRDANLVMFSRI